MQRFLTLIIILLVLSPIIGQDSLLNNPFAKFDRLNDSTLVVRYDLLNLESSGIIDRMDLPVDFHQVDPGWQNGLSYANLGNLGSSAKPLVYDAVGDIGFTLGFFAFDNYNLKSENAHFAKSKKPYTKVFYTQMGGQDNFIFKGEYSRQLSKSVLFSLEYQRYSHLGFYTHQRTKHTGLTASLWYHGPNNKYDAWLSFTNNFNNQQDNGGIASDTFLSQAIYQQRDAVPVKLNATNTNFNTRYTNYELLFGHYYSLVQPKAGKSTIFTLIHKFKWTNQSIKFADDISNPGFYGIFNTYPNGLRYFTTSQGLYNYVGIKLGVSTGKNALALEPGFSYNRFNVTLDTSGFIWSEAWLHAKLTGNLGVFNITATGQYGFADNKENFKLDALAQTDISKYLSLSAHAIIQKYPGTTMNFIFHISKQKVWDQDLKKIDEQALYLNLNIKPAKLNIFANQFNVNNYIYFDSTAYPRQVSGSFQIAQFGISNELKLWKIHLNNKIIYQTKNTDKLRLPQWVSNSSIFFEGRIFKKSLFLRPGVNLRYLSSYYADNYMPATGQFFLQDKIKLKDQLLWDLFVDFKVKNFQAFVKMENIGSWFSPDINYFAPLYPLPEAKFRFGIQWQFLN